MDKEIAKRLIKFIVVNMGQESAWLQPYPAVFMCNPYELLEIIQIESKATVDEVDTWMCEAQNIKRTDW